MATPKALSGNPLEEAIADSFELAMDLVIPINLDAAYMIYNTVNSDLYEQLTDVEL